MWVSNNRRVLRARAQVDLVERADIVCGMSLAEIKEQVDKLTPAEKAELEAYLRTRTDKDFAARRERVSAIMREMDVGRKFSRSDLENVDRKLTERGL